MMRNVCVPLATVGAFVLMMQILMYLHDGVWVPVSLLDGVRYIAPEWSANPSEWIGAHRVLAAIPAGASALLIGIGIPLLSFASFCLFSRQDY